MGHIGRPASWPPTGLSNVKVVRYGGVQVSIKEVSDFIRSVPGLEDYALGCILPPESEDRWDLYFRVQTALLQLRPHRSALSRIAVTAEYRGQS